HAGSPARAPASAPAVADVLSQWRAPSWLKQQGVPVERAAAPMAPATPPPPAGVPESPAPSFEAWVPEPAPAVAPESPAPSFEAWVPEPAPAARAAAQPAPDTRGSGELLEIVRGLDPGTPLGSAPPLEIVAKAGPEPPTLEVVAKSDLEPEPGRESELAPPLEIVAKSDLEPEPGSMPPLEGVRSVEPPARGPEARQRPKAPALDRSPETAIKSDVILPLGASVEN